MGWASGSALLSEVWAVVREYVPVVDREEVLLDLMYRFADHDCDTLAEVIRADWPESEGAYQAWFDEPGDPEEPGDA